MVNDGNQVKDILDFILTELHCSDTLKEKFRLPDKIYHYTTLDSFMKIISNRKKNKNGLWLSNSLYLNDSKEIKHGQELLEEFLSCKFEEDVKINRNYNYYIASFSLKDDDLNQWKAYSKDAKGVCIEFDLRNSLYFNKLGGKLFGCKVIYEKALKEEAMIAFSNIGLNENELQAKLKHAADIGKIAALGTFLLIPGSGILINSLLSGAVGMGISELIKNSIDESKYNQDKRFNDFYEYYGLSELDEEERTILMSQLLLPFFKLEHFKDESEFRFIHFHNITDQKEYLKFRLNSNGIIVPYIETQDLFDDSELLNMEISRVILGSNTNDDVKCSIENFLECNGYGEAVVESSKSSYRA